MKYFLAIVCLSLLSSFSSDNKVSNQFLSSLAPCTILYASNTSQNADDMLQIKLTHAEAGNIVEYNYDVLSSATNVGGVYLGYPGYCGYFKIEIVVSVGGNCSVGIRNKNTGAILICQNVCCGEGMTITFNNVYLSSENGMTSDYEIFLKNGSC